MNIQKARESDLDSWASLRHALWPAGTITTLRDEAISILASPDQACLLLLDGVGTAAGFAEVAIHQGPAGPYGHLEGWYVTPEYRGRGLGRKLISGIEQWCLHRAIGMLTSDTTPDYPLIPALTSARVSRRFTSSRSL